MPVKIIVFIILVIIFTIFAVKNMDFVEVSFYDFSLNSHDVQVPLLIVVLISLGFGFLLAWVDGWIAKMKLKSTIRRNDRIIQSLNEELLKYRKPALPESSESEN